MVVVRPCALIPGEARILIMFESTFQDGNFFMRTHNGHFGRQRNKTENVVMSSLLRLTRNVGLSIRCIFPRVETPNESAQNCGLRLSLLRSSRRRRIIFT